MGGGGSKGPKYLDPQIVPARRVSTNKNNLIFEPFMSYNEYVGQYFIHYYNNYLFGLFFIICSVIIIFIISIILLFTCSFKIKKKI
jgi:hypothetical protein